MKRKILTGLVLMASVGGVMAQIKPKSKEEAEAVQALAAAESQSPDAVIKAAEDLLAKFADTEYKEVALLMEADAYQKKGDYAGAEITDQRVLEANPKNAQAAMQLGELIVQHVRENDLDKDAQLAKAEKDFDLAMSNLDSKPAVVTEDKWEAAKKQMRAEIENDQGLVALARKNYDTAATQFKKADDIDPQPAYQVRLASAYQQGGKNDDAIAICDKLLADPQLHPTIRRVAEAVKTKATQAKSGAGK